MSNGSQTMMVNTTETADMGYWKFKDPKPTVGEATWERTRPSECG